MFYRKFNWIRVFFVVLGLVLLASGYIVGNKFTKRSSGSPKVVSRIETEIMKNVLLDLQDQKEKLQVQKEKENYEQSKIPTPPKSMVGWDFRTLTKNGFVFQMWTSPKIQDQDGYYDWRLFVDRSIKILKSPKGPVLQEIEEKRCNMSYEHDEDFLFMDLNFDNFKDLLIYTEEVWE